MDSLDFQIQRTLLKAGSVINNTRDNDLRVKDLTSAQSETILYYANHGGANIKDLSVYLKITHQAARKLVEKLHSKGILNVQIAPDDKRNTSIFLTEAGETLYRELKDCGTLTGQNLLVGFTDTEKEQLSDYLQRILSNIRQNQKKPS